MRNVHATVSALRDRLAQKPESLTHEHVQQAADAAQAIGSYEARVLYVNVKKAVEANESASTAE